MHSKKRLISVATSAALALGLLVIAGPALAASSEKVLYSFCAAMGCADGEQSWAGLIFDSAGNLYGTTAAGGNNQCASSLYYGCGTVFELSPGADGHWTETVLYSFCSTEGCADGANPYDSLIFDSAGNLYGTTTGGGSGKCFVLAYVGCGTVFELSPGADGKWTETVLYAFCSQTNCTDGLYPYAGLTFDSAGNLYGTTANNVINTPGGCLESNVNCGKVFELKKGSDGRWTYKVLHTFTGEDGDEPMLGNLTLDAAGNLYGTTNLGGNGCGTVFELAPTNGEWTETVLHSFLHDGRDGCNPLFGVVFDSTGNLWGTTYAGGSLAGGTVFRLSPGTGGQWTENVLFDLDAGPGSGLVQDSLRNWYGSLNEGGTNSRGAIFRLSPGPNGYWKNTGEYSFQATDDAAQPTGNLILDSAGNLYGTTFAGGTYGGGTVFEITP